MVKRRTGSRHHWYSLKMSYSSTQRRKLETLSPYDWLLLLSLRTLKYQCQQWIHFAMDLILEVHASHFPMQINEQTGFLGVSMEDDHLKVEVPEAHRNRVGSSFQVDLDHPASLCEAASGTTNSHPILTIVDAFGADFQEDLAQVLTRATIQCQSLRQD